MSNLLNRLWLYLDFGYKALAQYFQFLLGLQTPYFQTVQWNFLFRGILSPAAGWGGIHQPGAGLRHEPRQVGPMGSIGPLTTGARRKEETSK